MAFIADMKARRTWDPESGWELFDVTDGPSYPHYELRHANHPTLRFWCVLVSREPISEIGKPTYHKVMRVRLMSASPAAEKERQLIHAALLAFGYFHNGPSGSLDLKFED